MAIINPTFILLFMLCSSASAQQILNSSYTIGQNASLTPTGNPSSWLSPSGIYAFGFYKLCDGVYAIGVFMAGVPGNAVVWTANQESPFAGENATLWLTDSQINVRLSPNQERNVVRFLEKIGSAYMNDSGNFIIYNSANEILWQSFDYPSDTLLPGQVLAAVGDHQQLFSSVSEDDPSRGPYRLVMQVEGILRLYPSDSPNLDQFGYWNSGPETYQGGPNISLHLNQNGYMYMKNDSAIIHNLTSGGFPDQRTIYRAKIDLDGVFRLYSYSLDHRSGRWIMRYQTNDNKCDPKGVCGFNSFCINIDTDIECKCLPGFEYASQDSNRTCSKMNSPTHGLRFEMKAEQNTLFLNESYDMVKASEQGECEQVCLEDGNCEAALFNGGYCGKQRLPLRYGRRNAGDPTVTLVKVLFSDSWNSTRMIKKELHPNILIVSICVFALSVMILSGAGFLVCGKTVYAPNSMSRRSSESMMINDVAPKAFTYAELEQATNEFDDELILGRGAFGTVYKATLPNCEKVVAVKRLEKVATQGGGEREFENEMAVIGKTHHRNLVRLLGYCLDGVKRLLVYEYMRNGSLADVLFVREKNPPTWDERIKMACDIARGIQYLHEECETQVIHCDIKPENILMDEFLCAKISDFGMAKLLKHDQTKTFTAIRGTKGYVAPEWHQKLPVTVKADVYSFGIVLLEIVCVRKSVDWSFPEDEAVLEEWAYDAYEANEIDLLVANNEEVVDIKKVERVVKIAMWCIQVEPSLRPTMKKVLMMLEGTVDIPAPPNPTSFFSTVV